MILYFMWTVENKTKLAWKNSYYFVDKREVIPRWSWINVKWFHADHERIFAKDERSWLYAKKSVRI